MKKPFGIWDKKNKKFVEHLEYPRQAENYMDRRLGNSKNFCIIDKRKDKKCLTKSKKR